MNWLKQAVTRGKIYDDLAEEMRLHLEEKTERLVESGMDRKAAEFQAKREFGNATILEERSREIWQWPIFESILNDVRFALRQLQRAPAFAIVAIVALSLGIGASAAVFSVMDAILLRPLPFAHQERLVVPVMASRTGLAQAYSYPSYVDMRAQLKTFDALAGYAGGIDNSNLEGPSGPASVRLIRGTDNFFTAFGVKPILGRTYLLGEDQPGRDDIAVLSYEVWKTTFASQTNVVGKVIRLGGIPYTVIGVMPSGFRFPLSAHNVIYTPLHPSEAQRKQRGARWVRLVGLIKDGVPRDRALADIDRVLSDIGRAHPNTDGKLTGNLIALTEDVNSLTSGGKVNGPLVMLALACLALLGIACVNIAGLLLARGVKRDREMALRAAVGASRGRLVQQLLSESMVLCICGLGGGLLASWLLLKAFNVFLINAMARGADVHLNLTVVAVALGLSLLTSILASLTPAVRLSGTDPNWALRANTAGAGAGRNQRRLQSTFVVIQVGFSLVLLMVSGLLLRNLREMLKTDLGFNPSTILATEIDLSPGRYVGRDPVTGFYQPLLERISHLPGVEGVGVIDNLPVQSWGSSQDVHIAGHAPYPTNQQMSAEIRFVSRGYFDAMGIKLTRGRMLSSEQDRADINPAGTVIVNAAFQRKFFPNGDDPVGAHIDNDPKIKLKMGIVGVVTDVRQNLQDSPLAEMDELMDELDPKLRRDYLGNMTLVVRSNGDLSALVPSLRNALHEVDPTVPFKTPSTMSQVVSETLIFQRMESWLLGIFASFALLLAIIGLFGLVNYEVESRTREIGIRMALGSTRAQVTRVVLGRVSLLMLGGVSIGWGLTLALRTILATVVRINAAQDALLLAGLTASLAVIGILACLPSANRAASTDPMRALRSE
ncbi:ABC transporter permease [Granulicella sp. dw_53]|uniref:ABC transporter permease n=1 Tax=Granulicella sp. dw_53 TaxID=2719792 RepID=UPI001BD4AC0F|nr:ABC transporter permease [Granulicella sp. dw_53]